jgi:hypothetical protein
MGLVVSGGDVVEAPRCLKVHDDNSWASLLECFGCQASSQASGNDSDADEDIEVS